MTNDYISNYRIRLLGLKLLPLMHWYELQDLLYLVKCLQNPPDSINIFDHISFVASNTRRNQTMLQYKPIRTSFARHFYFNRIVKLWNAVQPVDISLPLSSIKRKLWNTLYGEISSRTLTQLMCVLTTLYVHVHNVITSFTNLSFIPHVSPLYILLLYL